MRRGWLALFAAQTFLAALIWAAPVTAQDWDNEDCLDCHADPDVVEIA